MAIEDQMMGKLEELAEIETHKYTYPVSRTEFGTYTSYYKVTKYSYIHFETRILVWSTRACFTSASESLSSYHIAV